jgi:hypothetical protein
VRKAGVENIADHGTIGPRKFLMLAERKKGGKKKGKRRERKERKEGKGKKNNRKKEMVNAPISSHFVQGQTLGVGGAPKIIYERTLIAECSLICRFYPLCWLCIVPLHWFQNLLSVSFPSLLNFNSQFLFL